MGRPKYVPKHSVKRKVQPAAQNPKFNKYRLQARKGIIGSEAGPSNHNHGRKQRGIALTEENLKAFQAMGNKDLNDLHMPDDDPTMTVAIDNEAKSEGQFSLDREFTNEKMRTLKGYQDDVISEAQTFATNFTNCTNASFNTFMQRFDPTSGVQKEMLSILAASTDIITANGNDGTEEEYFDVLLQTVFTCENVVALTANAILLYYVIRRLPVQRLREKFSHFQSIVNQLLKKHLSDSNVTFVRFILKSYTIFVKSLEPTDWELMDTQDGFTEIMLNLITCSKSRIRKVVHTSITGIVSNIQVLVKAQNMAQPESGVVHPISRLLADHCIRRIKETSGEDVTSALYVLNLFKEILPFLDTVDLKRCCETIIGLLLLGNVIIFTNSMQVLEQLFDSQSNQITSDLNNKLLIALQEYSPDMSDEQPFMAWCSVMKCGLLCAFKRDIQVFGDHFLKLFGQLSQCWTKSSHDLRGYVTQCMNQMLYEAVKAADKFKPSVFIAIGELIRSYLTNRHSDSFKFIFRLLCTFFVLNTEPFNDIVRKLFAKLLELHATYSAELTTLNFEKPVVSLLKHHGTKFVLDVAPFQVNQETKSIQNFWLIGAIKQLNNGSSSGSSSLDIATFIQHVMPTLEKLSEGSNNFVDEQGNSRDTNGWLFQHTEMCSLLPVFLNHPADVKDQFKNVAKILGTMLTHQAHARPFVQKSLRQLISHSKEADHDEVARFAKNFIPILLNLYFSPKLDRPAKLAVYETLSTFFSVADASLVETYYDKSIESCQKETDTEKRMLYMDILRVQVCHLKDAAKVIAAFEQSLVIAANNADVKGQKKAWRLIEELLKSDNFSVLHRHYESKGDDLYQFFVSKYASIQILSAQATFVRVVQHLICEKYKNEKMSLPEFGEYVRFLITIFESKKSAKLRQSTFSILYTLIRFCDSGPVRCIELLIEQLNAAKENFDRKATILYMLHNILLQYNQEIDKATKTVLIKALLTNLNSESRKMVTTILLFIKDWFRVTTKDDLLPFISLFIDYLNSISKPESPAYKYKIKNVVERLLKKYGFEIVYKLIDEKYHRLIKSLERRIQFEKEDNKKNKSKSSLEFEDSEDDDDEQMDEETGGADTRRKKSAKRWHTDEDEEFDNLGLFEDRDLDDVTEVPSTESIRPSSSQPQPSTLKSDSRTRLDGPIHIDLEGNIVEAGALKSTTSTAAAVASSGSAAVNAVMNSKASVGFDAKQFKKLEDDDEDEDDDGAVEPTNRSKASSSKVDSRTMASRVADKYKRKRGIRRDTTVTGDQYRSTRAAGDMKKPGIPDPYAYLPLNRSVLSKRKANKSKKQFQNLVKSAVKGARKGRY